MIVWFVAIGACGVTRHRRPSGNPQGALADLRGRRSWSGDFRIAFFALAAVVLAVTGAEALYADMGHFGRPADHPGLAVCRPAGVRSELSRTRCAAARRQDRDASAPFFLLTPDWARVADGAVGHRRNDHRVPGGDHRGVFGGVAGRSARLSTEAARGAYVGVHDRPDLRAVDQRRADGGRAHPGVRVPQLGGAGVRVRHGGDRDDHHHHAAVPLHRADEVADTAVADRDRRRRFCCSST